MILITIVKNDPSGLLKTYRSIADAVDLGLRVDKWLVKTSGPEDTSFSQLEALPSFAMKVNSCDSGIYDAMNQAVQALAAEDPRLWTCLLNAGDQLHRDFTEWYNLRQKDGEDEFGILIGGAITENGTFIEPMAPIIGSGGLNFCHQAALFRLEVLRKFPFPTRFRIAGDYAHFLSLKNVSYKLTRGIVCIYDTTGISEKSVLSTRLDNFRAGFESRGISEIARILLMLLFRLAIKPRRYVRISADKRAYLK